MKYNPKELCYRNQRVDTNPFWAAFFKLLFLFSLSKICTDSQLSWSETKRSQFAWAQLIVGLQFYAQADRFWYNFTVWTPETCPSACTQIKYWRQQLFLISSCSSISLTSVKTHQILSKSSVSPNFCWGFLGPNLFLKMRQISLGISGISEFRLFLWYVRNLGTCVCVSCTLLECLSGSCAFGGEEAF